jgi:hypothetical protein
MGTRRVLVGRTCITVCFALASLMASRAIAPTPVVAAGVDWPTYGFDSLRTGYNPLETMLGPTSVAGLRLIWAFSSAALERDPATAASAVFEAQPVIATGVETELGLVDLVLVGDDNGMFFALKANSPKPNGIVVWRKHLGARDAPARNDTVRVMGVIASAAVDRAANGGAGAVYVGVNGRVHALDLATGTELAGWPVILPGQRFPTDYGFIHDGLNVVNGQLYAGTSAVQDLQPWYGRLISVDTGTAAVSGLWYPLTGSAKHPAAAASGGGIWSPGGVAVDPAATVGGVYVATGNSPTGTPLYTNQVVNLSPDLTKIVSYASPPIPVGDYDYGSNPVVFQPTGCPTKLLAVKNKIGLLVIESIGSDGTLSVVQSTQVATTVSMEGSVAWDPADQLLLVTSLADGPAPYVHGLFAMRPAPDCQSFSLAWQTVNDIHGNPIPAGAISSPSVANGVAYFVVAAPAPQLVAVATAGGQGAAAGQVLWQSGTSSQCGSFSGLSAPSVTDGAVYMSCTGTGATVRAFSLAEP